MPFASKAFRAIVNSCDKSSFLSGHPPHALGLWVEILGIASPAHLECKLGEGWL